MVTKLLRNTFLTAILLASCTGRQGGEEPEQSPGLVYGGESHGSDVQQDQENPWFLGEAPIPFCVEALGPGINDVKLSDYRKLVEESFQGWKAFFEKYGLDKLRWGHVEPYLKYVDFVDGKARGLSVNAEYRKVCDDPKSQLRVVFVEEAEISKTPLSPSSLGAAIRGKYDHKNYRTGGTVWVRVRPAIELRIPREAQLKSIVLHELGHVFGMPHDSVFAMREGTAEDVWHPDFDIAAYIEFLGQIESPYWKYKLRPSDTLELNYHFGSTRFPDMPEVLRKGLQQDTSVFRATLTYLGRSKSGNKRFSFTVADQFGKANTFEGVFDDAVGASASSQEDKAYAGVSLYTPWCLAASAEPLCKPFRIYLEEQPGSDSDYVFAIPAYGTLNLGNQEAPVTIESSKNGGAVLRVYLADTDEWSFFSATGPRKKGANRWDW